MFENNTKYRRPASRHQRRTSAEPHQFSLDCSELRILPEDHRLEIVAAEIGPVPGYPMPHL